MLVELSCSLHGSSGLLFLLEGSFLGIFGWLVFVDVFAYAKKCTAGRPGSWHAEVMLTRKAEFSPAELHQAQSVDGDEPDLRDPRGSYSKVDHWRSVSECGI